MTLKRPESVLVVIYDEDKQILALQRQDDPHFWQSVTGSLEQNEEPRQTAIREVREEIGIDIQQSFFELTDTGIINQYEILPHWRHRYPPDCRQNTEYVFLLQISQYCTIQLSEHLDYRWVSVQQALQLISSETNRNAIQQFLM